MDSADKSYIRIRIFALENKIPFSILNAKKLLEISASISNFNPSIELNKIFVDLGLSLTSRKIEFKVAQIKSIFKFKKLCFIRQIIFSVI